MKFSFYISCVLLGFITCLSAQKSPVPRFASLKPNEVNVRVGPGPQYPVEWIYLKSGLPVEVIAEFDTWRKIRDMEGVEGWVQSTILCGKRHAVIQEPEVILYAQADCKSCPLVRLQGRLVVDLLKCRDDWCQVRIFDFKGWLKRTSLWGLYPQEAIN
jgi:SH3-like domain-containing protein